MTITKRRLIEGPIGARGHYQFGIAHDQIQPSRNMLKSDRTLAIEFVYYYLVLDS
jgi:hypothetical protein